MNSKAKKLASITAVGAGAIALTAGKAEAASIIVSNILNTPIGFSSNSNPAPGRNTVASHLFNTFASGPTFRFNAVSFSDRGFDRFVEEFGAGFAVSGEGLQRFSAGAVYTADMGIGNGFEVGQRSWNTNGTSTNGLTAFTDKYFLFVFAGATTEYGWLEASMSVTDTAGPSASLGPNLTIIQYAFDTSGAVIAAGDTGPTPEPSTLAEAALGALILGAEGLRRWRKRSGADQRGKVDCAR